jgi:fatty acid desaturase
VRISSLRAVSALRQAASVLDVLVSAPGAWRTWLVALAIYGAWVVLTLSHAHLPLPALGLLGGFVIAWHGSLQHETIHGHPSRSRTWNTILGVPPLALCVPYRAYRRSHLEHHRSELCDPSSDPESNYVQRDRWLRAGSWRRILWTSQRTLVGRVLLGPWLIAASQLRRALHDAIHERDPWGWIEHAVGVAIVLAWVRGVADMPIAVYLLCFVYPGLALTAMRSFAEHRPALRRSERSALVDTNFVWALLFLNNNLHAAHHRWPGVPWYRLPILAQRHREQLLRENGGNHVDGYRTLWRRHAFRPIDSAVHGPRRRDRSPG